ncbi:hypothetical protein M404DRAFT_992602 [Pisolithus tinctorius Marx 270]|uniref:Uncharacterized protein n=1 Tax=Pisolithus tinctorius Marx 270 TaxID=870435 RepID=A0A0C3JYY5_PISTI|nr:hypothetical protein M404DRAFT_992602 [Pisolithus tinctorius Marx 270]
MSLHVPLPCAVSERLHCYLASYNLERIHSFLYLVKGNICLKTLPSNSRRGNGDRDFLNLQSHGSR